MTSEIRPPTLLSLAGVTPEPGALSQSVVVVIDAQGEYTVGRLPLEGIETALDKVQELLRRAREAGAPVLHVVHQGRPGGLFDLDGEGGQILDKAAPAAGETIVRKSLPNAFAGTDLDALVKATGRRSLILAGFMTHLCISSTARVALDLGYKTTVVADATATRALPAVEDGGDSSRPVVSAADIQRSALAELADRFATVAPLAQVPA